MLFFFHVVQQQGEAFQGGVDLGGTLLVRGRTTRLQFGQVAVHFRHVALQHFVNVSHLCVHHFELGVCDVQLGFFQFA